MGTDARQRRHVDFGRLREALRGPGVDTRVWICAGRIESDPEAIAWDPDVGWIVDVQIYGGELDGEGSIPCRVAMAYSGAGATRSDPPELGGEVLIAITDGDPNANPVVIGKLHNEGEKVPTELQGLPLLEQLARTTHFTISPHGSREQWGGPRVVTAEGFQALSAELLALAGTVMLGGQLALDGTPVPATQPYVRGAQQLAALTTLLTALGVYATAIGAIPLIAGAAGPAAVTLNTAIASANAQLAAALSAKVFGE